MTAYVIGNITVRDPGKWAEYRSLVPETLVSRGWGTGASGYTGKVW